MHTDNILEFVAAKFNLNLAFVQVFISSYWLEIKIYIIQIILKHKIYVVLGTNACAYSQKNATSLLQKYVHISRNKIINKHTFQWILLCNSIKHN